ncbi:intraflagellar transport protein 56 [Anser cygnoides]|uniref:intraflagellar transport protein 56 n=1 Tax=Anser cygnoides TaxID=8845 RepID=UPI0034D17C85
MTVPLCMRQPETRGSKGQLLRACSGRGGSLGCPSFTGEPRRRTGPLWRCLHDAHTRRCGGGTPGDGACLQPAPVRQPRSGLRLLPPLPRQRQRRRSGERGPGGRMMLSRAKPAVGSAPAAGDRRRKKGKKVPQLEELLALRDFTGAIALLEFKRHAGEQEEDADLWIGYSAFHLGDYKRALEEYEALTKQPACNPDVWVNLACTYFFLGMYTQAEQAALKAPKSRLQNRLLFHLAHKFSDEKKLMSSHQNLQDITEDQLSLASIHYMRSHYQEAIDIYKRILLDNREYLALNVYVALCYYKLDYYDVSQEVLAVYLQQVPDSTIALNLKACNHFRLYNGKGCQAELKNLTDSASSSFEFGKELIKHNLVVFRGGEGALQVLPPLVDVIPEARLNLVIYYLRQDDVQEAYNLIKDLEPTAPQEYILKGVVNAALGQEMISRDHLKIAQQFFQLVGESASECDTIPGRQCMASCFFLLRQFGNVLIYLNSVKSYFYNDDTFNFNYAQAKAAMGNFSEAEEVFLLIQSEKIKNDFVYLSWLARCYIMNKKPQLAWKLYLKMETSGESFNLLQLIANDCYKMRQFYYAAKAFDVLERLDSNPEYWEGKRGACVGVFQMILAGREAKETLREVLHLLRSTGNSQVEYIIRIMKKWAKENRVPV